jgi:putative Holliday junction resolvase
LSRVIALDVGTKRVGVAFGDETTKVATPHDTFPKAQGRAESIIVALVEREQIGKVIVGLPLNEDGSLNEQCLLVIRFCRRLERRLNVPVLCVDEYLTSVESQEILGLSGKKERALRRTGEIDAMSAALILKGFLESGKGFEIPEVRGSEG